MDNSAEHFGAKSQKKTDEAPNARAVSKFMDELIRIPGTNITIGADVLLGLVPGVGDTTSTAMSGIIFASAIKNRVPIPVLLRMGLNLLIDWLIGLIPGVGDIADALFRANRMNMKLLDKTLERPEHERKMSIGYLIGAVLVVTVIMGGLIALTIFSFWLLWSLLTGGFGK